VPTSKVALTADSFYIPPAT